MSHDLITKVKHVAEEATAIAGAAARLAHMANEVLDHGGILQGHEQVHFIVGALMRLQLDMGVVRYKQQAGAVVRARKRIGAHDGQ